MGFQLEKDMTKMIKENLTDIIKVIKKNYNKNEYIYACEFPVYYRMIDITVARFYKEYNNFDECIHYEKLLKNISAQCFGILTNICLEKKISISSLEKRLLLDRKQLIDSINKLSKLGLIEKVSKYSYSAGEWVNILPSELIAIELKLSRWQEALEQGIFNQRFAEYSYVILDEDRLKITNKILDSYRDNNVGLMLLNCNGEIKTIHKAKRNKNIDKYENKYYKIKILKDFVTNIDKWN